MSARPSRLRRRAVAVAGALATVAGVVAVSPAPASATIYDDALVFVSPTTSASTIYADSTKLGASPLGPGAQVLAGNFSTASGGDAFVYNPGSTADRLLHIQAPGTSYSISPQAVSGTFKPFVGDFDGNGIDDIFWYAPGAAKDYLWTFTGAVGGAHSVVDVNVSGTYRPVVLDANGDGRDDVIWYAPGSGFDSLWLFGPGATTHTSKSVSIGADYKVVVGEFGVAGPGQPTERVVFYNPAGKDYFWTFDTAGNHTADLLPALDGNYQLLPGQFFEETYGSLYFYAPGSTKEHLWAFGPGSGGDVSEEVAPQVTGTYLATAGDFEGNGFTDVAFTSGSNTIIWRFKFDGTHTQTTISGTPNPAVIASVPMG